MTPIFPLIHAALCTEVRLDGLHPLALGHVEGAAAVAMAAAHAVPGPLFQRQVVLPRQIVPLHSQIVILVDEGDVQSGGAGVAVLAVDAAAHRASRGQLAQTGVVPIRRRRVKKDSTSRISR